MVMMKTEDKEKWQRDVAGSFPCRLLLIASTDNFLKSHSVLSYLLLGLGRKILGTTNILTVEDLGEPPPWQHHYPNGVVEGDRPQSLLLHFCCCGGEREGRDIKSALVG